MRKNTSIMRLISFFTATLLILSFYSCKDYCSELNIKINKALIDNEICEAEFKDIQTFIRNNESFLDDCYDKLFANNILDDNKLRDYILNIAKNNRRVTYPPKIWTSIAEEPLRFKFYLESSESMWAYDKPSTHGEFKSSIVRLLNSIDRIRSQDNLMYIVNTSILPFNKTFANFITQNNVFAEVRNFGNPKQTDFRLIFNGILNNLGEKEIAIMVSDLIYSTPDMKHKTTQMIANEVEGLTEQVFNLPSTNTSVLVVKLISSYCGRYFYFDPQTQSERWFDHNGLRPFYLTIFAKNNVMNRFLTEDTYNSIRDFSSLLHYEDFYLFQKRQDISPYYSIIRNHPNTNCRFRISKSQPQPYQIINLDRIAQDQIGNPFQIAIGIDLRSVHTSESFKSDIINYIVNNQYFKVSEVIPINSFSTHEVRSSTHIIVLKSDNIQQFAGGEISISLVKKLPQWINESSTLNDTNRNEPNFENTTFLFENMMKGLFRAYHSSAYEENYFTITLNLRK